MNKIQLELETVTPMFLHGHDNKIVELRPPPFKALFRYWWRATQEEIDVKQLREEEGNLFGSPRQRSLILIRISSQKNLNEDTYQPLPHHTGGRNCVVNNCPPPHEDRCSKSYSNMAYCPDEQFTIVLAADNLNYYESVAKLGFLIGGVGNRSRRGFGSIRDTAWNFSSVADLQNEISRTLDSVAGPGQFVINTNSNSIVSHLGFPAYPVIREIFFGQPMRSGDPHPLLKNIGQATHEHDNDALGYAHGQERMASPIHVRIQKVGTDYIPVVTQMHWDYPGYALRDLWKQQRFIDAIIN